MFNVDGFFVAKFKKTGPTPAGAVGVNEATSTNGKKADSTTQSQEEYVDKTPIDADEELDFGGWDDQEDEKYMERAQAKELRRKGKNPKAVLNGKTAEEGQNSAQKSEEKSKTKSNGESESKTKKVDAGAKSPKSNGVSGKAGGAESKPRRTSGGRKGKA